MVVVWKKKEIDCVMLLLLWLFWFVARQVVLVCCGVTVWIDGRFVRPSPGGMKRNFDSPLSHVLMINVDGWLKHVQNDQSSKNQ